MIKKFKVTSENGIHARPASKLVGIAMEFESEIYLTAFNKSVNLKSIMGVLSLGIYSGEIIEIKAEGLDQVTALNKISNFIINEGIGEIK
ncbi:MAG: HPr family phosphocarrier protein [Acholeplasmataceae bacterium]